MVDRRTPAVSSRSARAVACGQAAASARMGAVDDDAPLLSYVIGRLDRALRTRLGEALAPLELTIPQFTTLSVLRRRSGLSNAQLARRALILPQSMIQVVSVLEARGLVARRPSTTHARILETRLTPVGRRLVLRAERIAQAIEAELVQQLGDDVELARIHEVLQRWSVALGERRR